VRKSKSWYSKGKVHTPDIPIQEARLECSKGEDLSTTLAGSPPSKPEGGVLDCGVASAYGGGPL